MVRKCWIFAEQLRSPAQSTNVPFSGFGLPLAGSKQPMTSHASKFHFLDATKSTGLPRPTERACRWSPGRSEPRVPQPQPVVPTGLVAVTAPDGAGTLEGGSDHEAISPCSRGQEHRPRGAQAKVDPQIIGAARDVRAAQDERAGYRSQGAVRRHGTSADPGYPGARPIEKGRGHRAAAPARGSHGRRGRRRDGMAAAHRPRSLLRDAEEKTRSDPELGSPLSPPAERTSSAIFCPST